ncbi:cytochrome P450 [Nocardioides marmorisolisilvae]|uniref:Cytochrome P450 n=1 Tax=Nocardioides marmorisolisilvae TaxID=1542737 RepID=A0A3N0DXK6_9ACTN|nr:cytochrome P450 [Nocardioides marmorisolisilvae]RNL80327.1 cytochrome P450 [Nocardioides marmorisolisilvae]
MSLDFKHASLADGVLFSTQVAVPNVVQGLFRKRQPVVSAASLVQADLLAYRCTAGLVKRYGVDPFYVRVVAEEALLVHHPDDIRIVLGGSPSPFASDPDAKKKGMTAFQPNALTLSRGDLWSSRRAFAESVLNTSKPTHKLAKGFIAKAAEEADALLELDRPLAWEDVNTAFQRLTRRVVLGEAAAEDSKITTQLAKLMDAGNKMPGKPAKGYDQFHALLAEYVDAPDPAALTGMVGAVAVKNRGADVDPAGQLVHWLFAMGDTLPANLFRTIAVLADHPLALAEVRAELAGKRLDTSKTIAGAEYLAGCIQDTMRLWPTTGLFGRVTTEDVRFSNGELVPAGTQVLIHNLFNHRNRARVPYADRFAPEEWVSGDAASDWSFNFFSHGPQGCPGAGLSIFLGQAFLATLLTKADPVVESGPRLKPGKPLPYGVDLGSLKIRLRAA